MSNSCCEAEEKKHVKHDHGTGEACHEEPKKIDLLLWGSMFLVAVLFAHYAWFKDVLAVPGWYLLLAESVFHLMHTIWWGIVVGILMLAALAKIPREFVISILGTNSGLNGILRATAAGVLLDLCSHGILMVGAKLYERGASIGQVMAFLIASPWNSFSLTLILIALIGIKWTVAFIVLSMVIAIIVGLLFDFLVAKGQLPSNPRVVDLPENFKFWASAKDTIGDTKKPSTK